MKNSGRVWVIWLTNDAQYWHEPRNPKAGYAAFSVHQGAVKHGPMDWGANMAIGTTKGRPALTLNGSYPINWRAYSNLPADNNGTFQYAFTRVGKFARRV